MVSVFPGSKAHKSVRRIETAACRPRCARWARPVRRHTNPFDGLKLQPVPGIHHTAHLRSKAHKSVRRIETTKLAEFSAVPLRVRRHTNPFDGLKLSPLRCLGPADAAVRRHTNPFDGLKLGRKRRVDAISAVFEGTQIRSTD